MTEPERDVTDGDETLPPGLTEPDSEAPEADALEQQLPPDSGEAPDEQAEEASPRRLPGDVSEAHHADVAEQERSVDSDEDEYDR